MQRLKGIGSAEEYCDALPDLVLDLMIVNDNDIDENYRSLIERAEKYDKSGFTVQVCRNFFEESGDGEKFEKIEKRERMRRIEETEVTAETIADGTLFRLLENYNFENEREFESCLGGLRQKAKNKHLTAEFDRIAGAFRREKSELFRSRKKTENRDFQSEVTWLKHSDTGTPYINEPEFIKSFVTERELKCIRGQFFSVDGLIPDGEIKHTVQKQVSEHIVKNIARVAENLYKALINHCYSEQLKANKNEIHVKNGVLKVNGDFVPERRFCINRLNVEYNPEAPKPKKWLEYLNELIEPDDILTFQEYLGYCFIPSTKAQTMLFLIGNGGEGKGVTGEILSAIFKNNMVTGEVHKIATDRFIGADLENKLLMLDDDINFTAIPDTGKLKSLVTATSPFRIERKYADKYDAYLYTRLICFGNNCLNSLYDHTDGFYRRQVIIRTKPKNTDREDNPNLAGEIIAEELDGVFMWAFEGLQRLIRNNFSLTVSEKSRNAIREAKEENFNFELFLKDEATFSEEYEVTTADLYESYYIWCGDNGFTPFKRDTITKYLKNCSDKLNISYSEHCLGYNNRRARGFKGMKVKTKHVPTVH